MTEILQELQAGYDVRAQIALERPPEPVERAARPKATRTYTGEALERRRAWGRLWGGMNAENARHLPTERE